MVLMHSSKGDVSMQGFLDTYLSLTPLEQGSLLLGAYDLTLI